MILHIFPQRLQNKQVKKKNPSKPANIEAGFLAVFRVPNNLDPPESRMTLYLVLFANHSHMIPVFCAPEHRAGLLGARERPFTIRADCLTDEHWEAVSRADTPRRMLGLGSTRVCLRNFSSCTLSSGPPDKSLFEETACEHTPNYSHLAQSVHFRKKENDGQ